MSYLSDPMNTFDLFSIFPFYLVLFQAILTNDINNLDFSILASSPEPLFLITLRSFRVLFI